MQHGKDSSVRQITMADWQVNRKQKKLIKQVLKSGRLTYGDKTRELEERFAKLHGVKYALFTSSGTAALKIALHALKDKYKWKDGDEVIIPAVTFVATMNVVIMNNLQPVLVDVKEDTVNIDPELIEQAITKKTRAILPVHLLGQPAAMKAIVAIAKKHNLKIVEDSCETMFVNKVRGDIACFSTYFAHLLVTGVGGFITTNDKELATTMRSMMFHGRDESYLNIDDKPIDISKRFYFPRFGYSDRMTELEAALGWVKLDDWEWMILQRQHNAKYIADKLSDLRMHYITIPVQHFDHHAFMFFPLLVIDRDNLMVHLEEYGIQTEP
jgi:perosamine synthetase